MPNRIERSTALPADLFSDDAVFELELGEIWHRDWVFATPADAVAEPGDHVPVQIGRHSVIVVRGNDHELRALANVCSHRGTPLITEPGSAFRFACPYHAWTYSDRGELLSVPYAHPEEVVTADHCLDSYTVAQWQGLVFVSINPDVEPLTDRLGVIDPYVRPLAIERLHHRVDAIASETWEANWKLVFANAVDTYSHFRNHAETIEPVSPTDGVYPLAGSARATVVGGEAYERADYLIVSIPPSFIAVVWPHALLWIALRPQTTSSTGVEVGIAGEQPGEAETAVELPGWDPAFLIEDRTMCEQIQRHARSPHRPGTLLQIERALADFHDYLTWRLLGDPPEEPTRYAAPGDRPE